jgi:DNA (cytosine-5)-methyltransferase 1
MAANELNRKQSGNSKVALRQQIAALSRQRTPNKTDKSFRSAVATCARSISLNLDDHWQRATAQASDGYVDVIDMFSGCGGMSAGFKAVNGVMPAYRIVLAVDIDSVANRTYKANIGLDPVMADVSGLSRRPDELKALLRNSKRRQNHPLVLIGCAPCQGFSSHRNRAGGGDKRNPLFVEFAKAAAILRPDAVVVENVPELLTTQYWPYVQEARHILEKCGYFVYVGVHNIAEFGVPHNLSLVRPGLASSNCAWQQITACAAPAPS